VASKFPGRHWRQKIDVQGIFLFNRRAKNRFDRWLRDYPRATPVAVFCAALVLVALAAWSVELAERRIWIAEQQTKVDDVASTFERQAATDAAYLAAMGSLLGNVSTPSPQVFRNYVGQLRGISELNGVIGLGWIERFDRQNLPDLRERLGLPSGNREADREPIAPPFETSGKWPVYLVGMLEDESEGSRWSTTLDSGDQDPWVRVMDRVMKSGTIGTGDWTEGAQAGDRRDQPTFVVLSPAPSARGEPKFRGVAFGLVRTKDFAAAAIDPGIMRAGQVEIVQRIPGGERRIFSSEAHSGGLAAALSKDVQVFDQHWTLRYWPQARSGLSILSMVILFGGAAFALLLLAYVLLVQRRTVDLHAMLDAQLLQERERTAFVRELNHRVKNTLANVTSIISLTRNRTEDVQDFADMLLQRVRALAAGHTLLESGQWGPADLRAIFSTQLLAHDKIGDRIALDGPSVEVVPQDALTIGLAVHELTTNSMRYGALSADQGRISVRWHVIEGNWVQVDWEESGGPAVVAPEKLGFGLMLVQRALAHELHRPIDITFDPAGFRCRFFFQLREAKQFQLRR
jgi:two-component sensor histidine kinase